MLGVAPDAPHEEVRAAYRRSVRELHPDSRDPSLPAADADAALRLVQGAWEVLGDERLRRAYDERLARWQAEPPTSGDASVDLTPWHRPRFPWWVVVVAVLLVIFVFTAYAGAPPTP
ncbi:MAG TPA: J domain-containing protein [Acidimicrobiales bacterium]|nr:J domain-containing protein [Acidimicrobiales bacterium]